jgi:hypothetical protein
MKRLTTILLLLTTASILSGCFVQERRRCPRGSHYDRGYCVRNR